jgi:opacity protein-like surface antigen
LWLLCHSSAKSDPNAAKPIELNRTMGEVALGLPIQMEGAFNERVWIMRTKIRLAALLAATCLTTPVLAADLYTKAPPLVAAPILYADWSGVYVGLEAGYGWGHNSFDPFNSVTGFGGAGNIANILNGGTNLLFPDFTGVGAISSINQHGWMAGGFAGAQKQWGSWVLGVEADFDAADIHGSVQAIGVQHDVMVTSLSFGSPSVSGTVTVNAQDVTSTGSLTIPGQTVTSTGTATVVPVNVHITGLAHPCQTAACPAGQFGTPATFVPGSIIPAGTTIFIGNTLAVLPLTQTGANLGTVAGNNIGQPLLGAGSRNIQGDIGVRTTVALTVGAGGIVTVALPGFHVPGQAASVTVTGATGPVTLPLTVTGTVPAQTVPLDNGIVNASVLQQTVSFANVTRTLSVDTKIDELGSLRGKVGFTPAHDWLLYATGGLAWAHATSTVNAIETLDFGEGPLVSHAVHSQGGGTMLGWALGAGVDWKHQIDQGSAIVLGLEYLHYEFPKNAIALADGGVSANFVNNHQSVDAIKGRVSYLFDIH